MAGLAMPNLGGNAAKDSEVSFCTFGGVALKEVAGIIVLDKCNARMT